MKDTELLFAWRPTPLMSLVILLGQLLQTHGPYRTLNLTIEEKRKSQFLSAYLRGSQTGPYLSDVQAHPEARIGRLWGDVHRLLVGPFENAGGSLASGSTRRVS